MTRRRVILQVGSTRLTLDLDLQSSVQRSMADALQSGGAYEEATDAFLRATIQPGDTVVDIGAHVGYFTCLMAALVGPTGRVYAFEPNPENYQRLLTHLSLNNLTWVTPFHMAVGDRCGVTDLWINKDNDGGHALYDVGQFAANTKSRAFPQRYPVWLTTLDALHLPASSVAKLDIEGAEHSALKGWTHKPPTIVSEIHRTGLDLTGSGEGPYRAWMTQLGYRTALPMRDGGLDVIGPTTTAAGETVFNVVFTRAVA